jgi:uridine phosphorylase
VAQFRDVKFGQILYGGDDVSGEIEWDHREWHTQFEVREHLFWLAAEACLKL